MDPIPLFLPINIISEFATPVSLSLRLFGNVMAGTIMLALYYGMLPVLATVVIPSFLHAYLDLFSGAIRICLLYAVNDIYLPENAGIKYPDNQNLYFLRRKYNEWIYK